MSKEKGSLSIDSENIFPIIKKWLYSDHDIFFRELISNGTDAITKMRKLEIMGEAEIGEDNHFKIDIIVNPEEKTVKFIDTGIGMTEDEVKEYINQIAFSGAKDFIEKYKDKTDKDQIIGHFGLGFYSAFMVANRVTIDTLSWQEGSKPVFWESESGTEYEMSQGTRQERGTEITLYLNEESYEFCNEYRAREILGKYSSFMPEEIYFTNANAKLEEKEDEKGKDGESKDSAEVEEKDEIKPINETKPLWTRHPNDCTDEEYKEFYREVFHDYKEPLFWIHLNMDYPFNLKGILYFPKINTEYDSLEGMIKLYNNQVFIADNIKEVIPEFLMLLKGVIDCPDIPLNVSRSALQNDGFVHKISDYISKKVADKLSGMYKVERDEYERLWDDINPFIKFGALKEEKFAERMNDYIIYKNLNDEYISLDEYIKANYDEEVEEAKEEVKAEEVKSDGSKPAEGEKEDEEIEDLRKAVYYVSDEKLQSQYINMFKEEEMDAIILTHNIDQSFITYLEQNNPEIKFLRVDGDIADKLTDGEEDEETEKKNKKLTKMFKKILKNDELKVRVQKLKNKNVSSMITISEESRRMEDMMKAYSMPGMDPAMFGGGGETLVLNSNNELVKYLMDDLKSDHTSTIIKQLYDLASLSNKPLEAEAMTEFIKRSNEIMYLMVK